MLRVDVTKDSGGTYGAKVFYVLDIRSILQSEWAMIDGQWHCGFWLKDAAFDKSAKNTEIVKDAILVGYESYLAKMVVADEEGA